MLLVNLTDLELFWLTKTPKVSEKSPPLVLFSWLYLNHNEPHCKSISTYNLKLRTMAAVAFPKHAKSLTLSTNHTYSYVLIAPTIPTKSTILFLHGFPSSSYDWRHQISFFAAAGHGVLVPDLLGYGGTSKPISQNEYRAKGIAAEMIEILEHEELQRVHAVSHDMGSILLSRLANYFPDRLLSTTFLVVPYSKPGERFNLEAVNNMTKQLLGKERFGYIDFFVTESAGAILDEHVRFSLFLVAALTLQSPKRATPFSPSSIQKTTMSGLIIWAQLGQWRRGYKQIVKPNWHHISQRKNGASIRKLWLETMHPHSTGIEYWSKT